MVPVVADVVDQVAVAIEDQHVLVEGAGRQTVHRGEVGDRLGRKGRNGQQRQSKNQDRRHQDEGAPGLGAALALAEQAQAPVKGVAGATAAGHQAPASRLSGGADGITKDDSVNVGNRVWSEINAEYVGTLGRGARELLRTVGR